MPSTQCYDDLPSRNLPAQRRQVDIKSKVIYSARDYAEQCKGCMTLEHTKCKCSMASRAHDLLDSGYTARHCKATAKSADPAHGCTLTLH